MFVIGAKEAESRSVGVRSRVRKSAEGTRSIEEAVALIREEIATRALPEA
jgi:threonyl-tRNA synthetase